MAWHARGGVAFVNYRRRGSFGTPLMLFAWLLVLATDVLRRLGATIAWLLTVAVLYVELLVIID